MPRSTAIVRSARWHPTSSARCVGSLRRVRLVRFRFGDRIATGASEFESETIRVLKGTFFEDPLPPGEEVPFDDVRLLAPVLPSKVVCVGKNYAAHAAEFGMEGPGEPDRKSA